MLRRAGVHNFFPNSRNHLKILAAIRVTLSKFCTEGTQILGATVQNVVVIVIWRPGFVHPWHSACNFVARPEKPDRCWVWSGPMWLRMWLGGGLLLTRQCTCLFRERGVSAVAVCISLWRPRQEVVWPCDASSYSLKQGSGTCFHFLTHSSFIIILSLDVMQSIKLTKRCLINQ
jgi:hypothetical protein